MRLKVTSSVLTIAFALSFASCAVKTEESKVAEETTAAAETEANETTETTEVQAAEETAPQADDLIFPDEPYDADKVHPIREPGDVTGEEAVLELNAIESSYLQYFYNDNYAAINVQIKDPAKYGITCDKVDMGEVGAGDYKTSVATLKGMLDRLYKIDFESLDKQDRDFCDQIVFDIEEEIYYLENPGFVYLEPAWIPSDVSYIYQSFADIRVRNEEEAENLLTLLGDVDRYFDDVCDFEEKRIELGYAASDLYYASMMSLFNSNTLPAQTDMLRTDLEEELNAIEGLSEEKKNDYLSRYDDIIENIVVPEFKECSQKFCSYTGSSTNEVGLCGFEHGKELYEHQMRAMVGRDCDVDELVSYLDEYLAKADSDYGKIKIEGKDEFEILDNTKEKMKDYFPEIDFEYEIVELPKIMSQAGIGGVYMPGYLNDNSHEIIFLKGISYGKDVVLHEGLPGHMYQFSYHKQTLDHPYFLVKENSLYAEGWATYIMGNPADMYGIKSDTGLVYMTDQFFDRYLWALLDIGVNYEGWTEREAADHVRNILGNKTPHIDVDSFIVEPGMGIYYGLGCVMTIKTLEEIRALDPDMDIKTMHTLYLDAAPGTFERILDSVKRDLNK